MIFKDMLLKIMDLLAFVPDEPYLKLMYLIRMRRPLHLNPPVTLSEKTQYLKIHDHSPEYPMMADKYEAKAYVAKVAGEKYVIPCLGVWERAEDIDFDSLPDKYVLKCTHDSGSYIIVTDKSELNKEKTIKYFAKAVKRNYYNSKREWSYHGVKGRIIAEQLLENTDLEGNVLDDPTPPEYKFFCFNGEPKIILTIMRAYKDDSKTFRHFYDEKWNLIPVGLHGQKPLLDAEKKPDQFEEMYELAKKFSKDIPSLRVDFYLIGGRVYVGELTFYHQSGFEPFNPHEYDRIFGEYLDLGAFMS